MEFQSTKETISSNQQYIIYYQYDDNSQYDEVCKAIYSVELNIPESIKNNFYYEIKMNLFNASSCIYNYTESILANQNLIGQFKINNHELSYDFSKREELYELSEYFEQTLVERSQLHTIFQVNIREQEQTTQ